MKKTTFVIIENSIDVTGSLKSAMASSYAFHDILEFIFILPSGSQARKYVEERGYKVYELPLHELKRNWGSWIIYFPWLIVNVVKLRRLLRKMDVQAIVVNDFYNLLPAAYRWSGGKLPYVCYVRFRPTRFPAILVNLWFSIQARFAQRIIAVSQTVLEELPAHEKIIQISDPLPTLEIQTHFSYDRDSRIILYLANYSQGKGQEYALTAFSQIVQVHPEWRLRFVGSDMGLPKNKKFKRSLQMLSESLGMKEKVEWNDFSTDVAKEYRASALVLNFSDSESFSLTCMEALYAGRPVVATRSGGPSEIIEDGVSGVLVPVKNVGEMKDAMDKLIREPALRQQMGAQGYARVREKFDRAKTIQKLSTVYFPLVTENKEG